MGWRGALFGYERRHHPVLPWPGFRRRLAVNLAWAYALYSGLAVLAVVGLVLAPLIHRLLHHFHAADDADTSAAPSTRDSKPKTSPRKHR